MGELNRIGTDDLRFTFEETQKLFAEVYGTRLETDVLREIGERTQGWAASLQLLHRSIHGRQPSAIRALTKSLSGSSGPIYDFLAQEVLRNLPTEVEEFLVRASLLDQIEAKHVLPLYGDRKGLGPDLVQAAKWIAEGDRLGLLARSSRSSESRQLHPLLREFLSRALTARHSQEAVRAMHLALAETFATDEPLVASWHFIEAQRPAEAMEALGRSVLVTMGSGRWGVASSLIDRLDGVPAGPAVATIRARRYIQDGDLERARHVLEGVDLQGSDAEVRSVFRHAQLSIGWRSGDRDAMFAALEAIRADPETPPIMLEIAQIFVDASPLAIRRASLPALGHRLGAMAERQSQAGLKFYSAISLHNAAVAYLNSADLRSAVRLSELALAAFDELPFPAPERTSTRAIVATAQLELGDYKKAGSESSHALEPGDEFADVPAELAWAAISTGDRRNATQLIARAEALIDQSRTDSIATAVFGMTRAFHDLPHDPASSIDSLRALRIDGPMDFGYMLAREWMLSLAYLLGQRRVEALTQAESALLEAKERLARRAEARLEILVALGHADGAATAQAIVNASTTGHLALLDLADGISDHLDLLPTVPNELEESVTMWPKRWLPAFRRQLDRGDVPSARAAARLLDKFGEIEDVGRLRAFARTYRRRGRFAPIGIALAQRVSPVLQIHDLGPVSLTLGQRQIGLAAMRRKPASLLMYLITRPGFAANREQVFDELWPDNDPASASNSLNQSLYFLRRELDPWYEVDISVDYLALQGELVWIDPSLVRAESAAFLAAAQSAMKARPLVIDVVELLASYRGPFAPEFEYEEWAMAWRTRVHTAFLELGSRTLDRAVAEGDLGSARDIAVTSLEVDPDNIDLERRLVWLYWHLGARAAASAQFDHLASRDRADGVEPMPLEALVTSPKPP
jgi:DNA-binding SARP family transcriptional activator/tetratricopeptide (TPR) repeat protein